MLQEFAEEGHDSWIPSCKVGEGVSIYFMCGDAIGIYREFISRGAKASKPVVSNGLWVTHLSDPDGYEIAFESPANAPEDTELTDS
jgi:hypothetical protein